MPPKAPNLKFKPKLVLPAGETTAHPSVTPSTDDLSLVQLARLQGLYVEEGQSSAAATGAPGSASRLAPATATSSRGGDGAGSTSSGAAPARHVSILGGDGGGGGGGAGDGDAVLGTGLSSLLRQKGRGHGLSAHAALEEASRRHVDMSQYPDVAPALPVNSMDAIVAPAASSHGADAHSDLYAPLPLDASLPSRLAAVEGDGRGGATATTTTTTVPGVTQAGAPPMDVDGTAFLREAELEQRRAYAANTRFYEESLQAMRSSTTSATTATTTTNSTSSTANSTANAGGLLWMQLPRFQENAPFSFFDLPPGKVGELKVLRSGRIVLEIAGVYYDVSVEGYEDDGTDGACAMAVATQPSAYPTNPASKASCYELGLLQKKLVCTPTLP